MPLLQSRTGVIDTLLWGTGAACFTLLHASATGPKSLSGLADQLSQSGNRRFIAPGFAGYGRTEMQLGDSDRLTVNLAIAREVLGSQPSCRRILFGHSMGGLIALLTAVNEAQSGRPVDALILYEPILVDLFDVRQPAQVEARDWDRDAVERLAHHVRHGDAAAGVRYFVEAWNETSWEDLPGTARRHLIDNAENIVSETAAVSTCKLDRGGLAKLSTPTLLLRGSQSPPFVRFVNEAAAQALGNAVQTVLPGCGHMGPLLKPAIVAAAIERFLQTHLTRAEDEN